eukprot:CAMPEP_0113847462 /NCGR_PEP_ID=MMETSP0372-20130328/1887_1 /TAXON_ID=340204 /ORGANISM="Lankesteria abbotti" /LENGTH=91 /DNA_ID=CAMNT_0000816741 /DNA_START=710 /DNA_END=982 /DNA_ORIENTATION=+ /assembly_acc=CAM_ASM_000359
MIMSGNTDASTDASSPSKTILPTETHSPAAENHTEAMPSSPIKLQSQKGHKKSSEFPEGNTVVKHSEEPGLLTVSPHCQGKQMDQKVREQW